MPTYLYRLTADATRPAEYLRAGKLSGTALLSVTFEPADPVPPDCIVLDRYPSGFPRTVVLVASEGTGAGQYSVEGGGPGGPP